MLKICYKIIRNIGANCSSLKQKTKIENWKIDDQFDGKKIIFWYLNYLRCLKLLYFIYFVKIFRNDLFHIFKKIYKLKLLILIFIHVYKRYKGCYINVKATYHINIKAIYYRNTKAIYYRNTKAIYYIDIKAI